MKITLLYGGQSAEHDISILSTQNICQLIMYDVYSVQPIYITRDGRWLKGDILHEALDSADKLRLEPAQFATWAEAEGEHSTGVEINPGDIRSEETIVFPVLHGPNGEDGTIQGFLETIDLPYVGAGVAASAVGMDKIMTKHLFDQFGIPQVPYISFNKNEWNNNQEDWIAKAEGALLYPLFVKPANMGSSVGISRVTNSEELIAAVSLALQYDRRIVVEQGINAEEMEVAVLGNSDAHASVVGRLVKEAAFYDYDEKYINNSIEMEIPAQIDDEISNQLKEYALEAYQAIDGSGLARVDFFVTAGNDIYINEINTMPGFTQFSMYPVLWQETGLSQRDLVEELLQLALKRYETSKNMKYSL